MQETELTSDISAKPRPQTDLDRLDARLEQVDARAEISEESQDGINLASESALEFSDRLGINPDLTKVELSEIDGEEVEIATSSLGGNNSLEHFVTPESEVTVITIGGEQGDTGERITIKHTTPSEILIGDQPVTTAEDAATVEKVIKELSNEAGVQDDDAEQEDDEATESQADTSEAQPEQPELSAEKNKELHDQFIKNGIMPYIAAMGPSAALVLQEMGVSKEDFEAAINSQSLKLDQATMDAFQNLARNGARPESTIWKENPNATNMLGLAARESRDLLKNLWETALRRPKPEQKR